MGKTARLELRVSPEQKVQIQNKAKAAGLSVSELILATLEGAEVRAARSTPAADPALLAGLARVGNNLNQIARAVNSGDLRTLTRLTSIQQDLKGLTCTSSQ